MSAEGADGWSKVAGDGSRKQMSKSQLKKEKQRARERQRKAEEAGAKAGGDAAKPAAAANDDDTAPTGATTLWEKGEMLQRQKEERRKAQEREEAQIAAARAKASEVRTKKGDDGKGKKKSGAPKPKKPAFDLKATLDQMEAAAGKMNTEKLDSVMASVADKGVSIKFDHFASFMVEVFEGCTEIPVIEGVEAVNAPFRFFSEQQVERIYAGLDLVIGEKEDPKLLTALFASCVQKVVETHQMHKGTVGMLCVVQAFVRFKSTQLDLAARSLSQVFGLFKTGFKPMPQEEFVMPIITAYAQVMAGDPHIYLRLWPLLNMQLLLDKCSARIKDSCIACLSMLFPPNESMKQWIVRLRRVKHNRSPFDHTKLFQYLELLFMQRFGLTQPQKAELHRCWQPVSEACVRGPTSPTHFAYFLAQLERLTPESTRVRHVVSEFLNLCLAEHPEACGRVMVAKVERYPRATLEVLAYLFRHRWGNRRYAAQRHPEALVAIIDALLPKVRETNEGEAAVAMLDELRVMLTESSGGETFPIIWTLIILTTLFFVLNLTHLACRYGPETGLAEPCEAVESTGVLAKMDGFYKLAMPYAMKLQPYVAKAEPYFQKLWVAVGPYLTRGWAVLQKVYAKLHAKVLVHAAPYTAKGWAAAVHGWSVAKPAIISTAGKIGAVVNGAVLKAVPVVVNAVSPTLAYLDAQRVALSAQAVPHVLAWLQAFMNFLVVAMEALVGTAGPHLATAAAAVSPHLASLTEAVQPLLNAIPG